MQLHIILISLVKNWDVIAFYCPKGFQVQAGVQGRAVKFNQPEKKISRAQREKIFLFWGWPEKFWGWVFWG